MITYDPLVLPPAIELFLTAYIRREIRKPELLAKYPVMDGFEVDNVEPPEGSADFPAKLIVVRDDGTTSSSIITGDCSIGVTVLMGDTRDIADAQLAARVVHGIVRGCARVEPGNPVSKVTASTGPYAVTETQPRARLYSTHDLATVGESL